MNRGPADQPHIFLSRDQPGLKAESESQPGKLHVVYSAGPGLYEVLLPCTAPSLPHVHKGPNTQPQSSTYVLLQPSYFFPTRDTHMHALRSPRPASSSRCTSSPAAPPPLPLPAQHHRPCMVALPCVALGSAAPPCASPSLPSVAPIRRHQEPERPALLVPLPLARQQDCRRPGPKPAPPSTPAAMFPSPRAPLPATRAQVSLRRTCCWRPCCSPRCCRTPSAAVRIPAIPRTPAAGEPSKRVNLLFLSLFPISP
jgi:hypothetical protein